MVYSSQYIDHFTRPRGIGELDPHDGLGEVQHEGQGCFDRVRLTIRLEGGKVKEAKFRARACSGTIAACSALVEMIRDRDLAFVKNLTPDDIAEYLGGIPDRKRHSVELAVRALREALLD